MTGTSNRRVYKTDGYIKPFTVHSSHFAPKGEAKIGQNYEKWRFFVVMERGIPEGDRSTGEALAADRKRV